MNYGRLALATLGGFVAYFAVGTAFFVLLPQMMKEAERNSAIFRPRESQGVYMPVVMGGILLSILVLAVLYALEFRGNALPGGRSLVEGAQCGAVFGALIGAFVVCAFVVHNFGLLNISLQLTLMQAAAYFVQWTAVGTAIGLIYKSSV